MFNNAGAAEENIDVESMNLMFKYEIKKSKSHINLTILDHDCGKSSFRSVRKCDVDSILKLLNDGNEDFKLVETIKNESKNEINYKISGNLNDFICFVEECLPSDKNTKAKNQLKEDLRTQEDIRHKYYFGENCDEYINRPLYLKKYKKELENIAKKYFKNDSQKISFDQDFKKSGGSYPRYEAYKIATTVKQFKELQAESSKDQTRNVSPWAEFKNDFAAGYITIENDK